MEFSKKWYKPQNNFYKILGNVNIQKKILIIQIFWLNSFSVSHERMYFIVKIYWWKL